MYSAPIILAAALYLLASVPQGHLFHLDTFQKMTYLCQLRGSVCDLRAVLVRTTAATHP